MEDLPTPESRIESYLAKAAGMDVTPPEPKSRLELYLAKIAGMDVEVPEPTTREEHWLAQIVGIEPSEPLAIEGAVYIDNQKVDVRYLAVAAGVTGASLPEEPQNRKEMYWAAIASGGPTPPPTPTVRALKFTSPEAQTLGVDSATIGSITPNFEYSTDGKSWATWDISATLAFGNGVDLYIRGMNTYLAIAGTNYVHFVFSTPSVVECTGNIMHLFDYSQDLTIFPGQADTSKGVKQMFQTCSQLVKAPDLPATIVPSGGYYMTFDRCTALIEAPALPASTINSLSYYHMFWGCTSLVKAGTISAETIPDQACREMFYSCTSLVHAPTLLFTQVSGGYACASMFGYCNSMVDAPALPATSLSSRCYGGMFDHCSSLETIPALPSTSLAGSCYEGMFRDCKKIKMSESQSSEYPNEYVFGTNPSGYSAYMFGGTGGTFVGAPTQTTYYTANTIIS